MEALPDIRFGTCAWSFDDWRGVFYPEHLPPIERLGFYAGHLGTVEIDSTFYAAPSPRTAGHWLDATPEDFLFSCKTPREITHARKLRKCEGLMREFLDAMAPLRQKLACVLIQLPGSFKLPQDEAALRHFLSELPPGFRYAVEFRDDSWNLPRVAHLLEEHRICWAWNDITPIEKQTEAAFSFRPITTDFLYLRFMGDLNTKFREGGERIHRYRELMWPRDSALESWAVKIRQHAHDVARVVTYVNNHYEGFSPLTCQRFAAQFEIEITLPHLRGGGDGQPDDSGQLDLFG